MSHPATLLRELQGRARKRFGQHFLASEAVVERIVALADPAPGQRVVEIGPGLGVLSEALLARQAALVAVELDRDLAAFLRERHRETIASGQLRLVEADAARLDWGSLLPGSGWWCVANLPYNVGTRLVIDMASRPATFDRLVVMLQREVVQRFLAPPGSSERGSLSVAMQARAEIRLAIRVPAGSFHPPPRVESAVATLTLRPAPELEGLAPEALDPVLRAAFASPRRTLRRTLGDAWGQERAMAALSEAAIDAGLRPAELDLAAFARLTRAVSG